LLARHGIVEPLPRGKVVAVAKLSDVHRTDDVGPVLQNINPADYLLGDYSPGRFAWYFSRVIPLPNPIPATGAQGLWDWIQPHYVTDLIEADVALRHTRSGAVQ
jgi:hypothetical protein